MHYPLVWILLRDRLISEATVINSNSSNDDVMDPNQSHDQDGTWAPGTVTLEDCKTDNHASSSTA